MDFNYKQVILVREDLNLPCGKLAVQVAHASLGAALRCLSLNKSLFDSWQREGGKKVVLKIKNLEELLKYRTLAEDQGLITYLVRDAGKTVVQPGTITCLAIGPAKEDDVDKVTSSLPLL